MRVREAVQRAMRDFMTNWDVLVAPNFLGVAPPVEQDLNDALPVRRPGGRLGRRPAGCQAWRFRARGDKPVCRWASNSSHHRATTAPAGRR
jgi:hypothetical protein